MAPDRRRAVERPRPRQAASASRRDDDVARRRPRPGSGPAPRREVGVDQRDHDADAGEAQPDRQIFRPVRHQQRDHVALGEPWASAQRGVAAGALGELA